MSEATKITIWGRKNSYNVQKVLWCCEELGVVFDRIDLGGVFGGNNEKLYLDLNPNGRIPTIQDGSFILWESNSIVRYLVDKYGNGRLLPPTPEGRGLANCWMDWQLTTMGSAIVPLFWELIRTPAGERDIVSIQSAIGKTSNAWKILDDHLKENTYVAGRSFTIGDIPLGIWAYRWFNLPIDRPMFSNLHDWYDRLCQRLPYQAHVMIPLS